MRDIDEMAVKAAKDDALLEQFIETYKAFLINCAYKVTKKYISTSDDEWSITLIAFTNAVKTYDFEKGSFIKYAENLIKFRLIDYYRTQKKFNVEYAVNPRVFAAEGDAEENENLSINLAVAEQLVEKKDYSVKDEIEAANDEIKRFGFSFHDIGKSAPKAAKTKEACKKAVLYILDNKILINEILSSKQLPIKIIEKNAGIPRKILEHHRKYILAVMIILSGEYPHLAEYVSYIRKESHK